MQFLYPEFLYALGLTAIPVILHLLNLRRYKRMDFSDIRFLKELQEKNKRKKSLRDLIILGLRLLAITALVLAFAQPFRPGNTDLTTGKTPWVSIYLDNSLSMQTGNPESLMDQAKRKIPQLLSAYPEGERFQLLTNDFEGRHQRLLNKKELLLSLDEVKPSTSSRNLHAVQNRQLALQSSLALGPGHAYWLSDFQLGMQAHLVRPDSASRLFLVPLPGKEIANVWIDSAWFPEPFLRKGTGNKLRFRIRNQGENDFNDQPVVLKIDGVQKALRNISVGSGRYDEFQLEFTLDDYQIHGFSLAITDYPAVFDDVYFLRGQAREHARTLLVTDRLPFPELPRLYALDSFFQLNETRLGQIDFSSLSNFDALVLNQPGSIPEGMRGELKRFVEEGGTLLLIPSKEPSSHPSLRDFAAEMGVLVGKYVSQRMEVNKLEFRHSLFAGVFTKLPDNPKLPVFNGHWELKGKSSRALTALHLANELPALITHPNGKGLFCMLANGIDPLSGDFVGNPIFVPMMLNLPLQVRKQMPASYTIGQISSFTFLSKVGVKVLSLVKDKLEIRLEATIRNGMGSADIQIPLPEAGIYELKNEKETWDLLAFNYPRSESRQGFINLDEIKEQTGAMEVAGDLKSFSANLERDLIGDLYWRWMLLLVLLALVTELLLLRIWKK